ncbi:MAG: methyltransferase domain-containing protein [bacterium]|nr:methyltransferase domain-containing protein [bacterium]
MWFFYLLFIIIFILLFSYMLAAVSLAPWVPACRRDLARVFALADLKSGETFYDLGCGNGRMVFYAAQNFDVKAFGIELALPMIIICKLRLFFHKNKNVVFRWQNLFKADLSRADVVYIFGLPEKLKNKISQKLKKDLKPGARVVSYAFKIAGWQPVEASKPEAKDVSIYLYHVI